MRVRTRLACLGAGLALVTSAVVIPGMDSSTATFTDAEYARASVQASRLAAPVADGCDRALLTSATLRWTAPESSLRLDGYEVQLLTPGGAVDRSATLPAGTTAYKMQSSWLLGVGVTQTVRVRAVSGTWHSTWRTASVTTILGALGLVVIGSCAWQPANG